MKKSEFLKTAPKSLTVKLNEFELQANMTAKEDKNINYFCNGQVTMKPGDVLRVKVLNGEDTISVFGAGMRQFDSGKYGYYFGGKAVLSIGEETFDLQIGGNLRFNHSEKWAEPINKDLSHGVQVSVNLTVNKSSEWKEEATAPVKEKTRKPAKAGK
jgi:hypothetical protein